MDALRPARPAPGWYQDPFYSDRLRWWSGSSWTQFTAALPAQPQQRSRNRSGAWLALAIGMIVALLLALVYWPGGSSVAPSLRPGDEAATDQVPPPGVPSTGLEQAYAGSVLVRTDCGRLCVGFGGGVAVGPDTILTAEHVIDDSPRVEIEDVRGNTRPASVIAADPQRDLALLRVPAHGLPYVEVRQAVAVVGEEAHAVGSPNGTRRISHGEVTRVLDLERDGVLEIQTNADIDQGNSGGPLLDGQGRLLGIVVAEHERNDNVGWATSAQDVQEFLDAAASGTPAPDPTNDQVGPFQKLLEDLLGTALR